MLVNIIPRCNCYVFLWRSTFVGGISASSFAFHMYTDYNINCVFRAASDFFFLTLAERNFHIKYIATISEQKVNIQQEMLTQKFLMVGNPYTIIQNLELIIFYNVSLIGFEIDTWQTKFMERSLEIILPFKMLSS